MYISYKKYLFPLLLCSASCLAMDNNDDLTVISHGSGISNSLIIDETNEPQNITHLLTKFDQGEKGLEEEFRNVLHKTLEQGRSIQDLDEQARYVTESLQDILYNDREEPRFTDITSPYFLSLVTMLSSWAEDPKIIPQLRIRHAFMISCAYSSIPKSGLPIDTPYMQGILKWRQYIIDRYDELGIHHPSLYLDSCAYVKGIYERRAEKVYPNIPLDSHNPYIQLALSFMEKGALALKKAPKVSFYEGKDYLSEFALMHEYYLPKEVTLQDQVVKNTIQAFEQWIEYSINPPHKKMVTYFSISEDESDKGYVLWDFVEKIASQRSADQARANLGWLYNRIPQAVSQEPDYDTATKWFLSCYDRGYNRVREALELPEIASRIPKEEN